MTRSPTNTDRRHGVTLLEIMLVMALLVAVAAMAMPALSGPLDNHRLRKSADLVRGHWAKAHVKAIESGRTYVFRYQPSGDVYLVGPWLTDEDYLESSDLTTQFGAPSTALAAAGGQSAIAAATAKMEQLPEHVFFVGSETTADGRAALVTNSSAAGQATDTQWSSPIFFYPDGTASTARLVLMNRRGRCVVLTMRGMTAVIEVSELLASNEVQP